MTDAAKPEDAIDPKAAFRAGLRVLAVRALACTFISAALIFAALSMLPSKQHVLVPAADSVAALPAWPVEAVPETQGKTPAVEQRPTKRERQSKSKSKQKPTRVTRASVQE